MTIDQFNKEVKKLKAFVKKEQADLQAITGFNKVAFKTVIQTCKDVIGKIDELKKFFKMTNEEAQALAVVVLSPQIDKLFLTYLGPVVKTLYKLAPSSFKKSIAKFVVDTIVTVIRNAVKKKVSTGKPSKKK